MKILLLGELSGVHQELAPGLRSLGHEVVVAHSRLANPEFESDISLYRVPNGATGPKVWIREIISQLGHAPELTGFDIVQLITPKFFNWKIHGPLMRFLKRYNRKLVVVNTSCSFHFHKQIQRLDYSPCKECKAFDLKLDNCIFNRDDELRAEQLTFELADAIVATHFEYAFALEGTAYASKVVGIPLPININRHRPSPMPPLDRVRIWYGETRYGAKGSPFILPALNSLEASTLGSQVEIVRSGRLPFGEYLNRLDEAHIVIDQASSYGTGMNGLFALAHGRVVLSGAEKAELAFWGRDAIENPVINIRKDADEICRTLADLVERKIELPGLSRQSAAHVTKYHSAEVIARQYGALYRRLLQPVK